jgi:phage baseplate assembly protein W
MATLTEIKSVREFRDLDLNFTIHPVRKDINLLYNERAIVNSLKNIILTNHYERPFRPVIGSNIRRLLFENVDPIISVRIEKEIEETIKNFEPRVKPIKIKANPNVDENRYDISITFSIVNLANPITFTFYLERVR